MKPRASQAESQAVMAHDTDHLARLAYREAHARWTGDTVAADEAAAALDAAALHVDAEQWAAVYRATLVDNRHE